MSMKAWVVHYDAYGDWWLHGVYDSEEKVARFLSDPEHPWRRSDYKVEKVEVQ